MQKIRKRFSLILAVATVLLAVQGIALAYPSTAQDRPTMRFGVNGAYLGTLDLHSASGTQDRTAVDMIFNALVRFEPGNAPNIEPDIATAIPEPTMDGDSQVWTF